MPQNFIYTGKLRVLQEVFIHIKKGLKLKEEKKILFLNLVSKLHFVF